VIVGNWGRRSPNALASGRSSRSRVAISSREAVVLARLRFQRLEPLLVCCCTVDRSTSTRQTYGLSLVRWGRRPEQTSPPYTLPSSGSPAAIASTFVGDLDAVGNEAVELDLPDLLLRDRPLATPVRVLVVLGGVPRLRFFPQTYEVRHVVRSR
jgi:hypothetical protein